jgi:hypothetical protein
MIVAWRPGKMGVEGSIRNNGHAGSVGEEVEMHARCGVDVGKLKRSEKYGLRKMEGRGRGTVCCAGKFNYDHHSSSSQPATVRQLARYPELGSSQVNARTATPMYICHD